MNEYRFPFIWFIAFIPCFYFKYNTGFFFTPLTRTSK